MTAPLVDFAAFSAASQLAIAVFIGLAFGFALERAGLGDARKLAGQFYVTDFTVLKVMFSAIVTAMLGAYWLARLGVLDLARVFVPETYVLPQLAGGALFGIGFVLAGLCPGTSCVAAATGRGDGALTVVGMFAGVLATGLAFAPLRAFYASTARGSLTLPQLLDLPYGVVVCAIVAIALAVFRIVERWERRAA
ncbi:MAG: YeeE/YedE family protein [Acidobacteria bacterium]|nr:YeeE/YedE family protein [Acidobacteriota bacterium]MBV9475648.1 YeeE/YedE family protein [Acidobacteriota bacterium]